MLYKKLKKIILMALLVTTVTIGALSLIKNTYRPPIFNQISSLQQQKVTKHVDYNKVIIDKLQSTCKLQVLDISLNETITVKKGFQNFMLKNNKQIKIKGIGHYILDLDKITKDNIVVNNNTKEITIYSALPSCSVELLENENEYANENGLLIFVDQEITPEESNGINTEIKNRMVKTMQDGEYMGIAKDKANEGLNKLLNGITSEDYKVRIVFVG